MEYTPKWELRLIFHLSALLNAIFADHYFANHIHLPDGYFKSYCKLGGRLNYVTVWNLIIQAFFFAICIVNDVRGTNELQPVQKPMIRKIADYLYGAIVFPLGMFTGCFFWIVWFTDRELVYPSALDEFMPTWYNYQIHSVTVITVVVQLFLCYNEHPKSSGLKLLHCLTFCYVAWIFIVYFIEDVWVYPGLNYMSWPLKILFFTISTAAFYGTYFATEYVHKLVWVSAMGRTSKWGMPLFFHIGAISNSLFVDYYFANHINLPTDGYFAAFHQLGGRYNFLTVWNLIIQGVFFGICIGNDLFGTNELDPVQKPLIRKIADYLFGAIVFPLGTFIGCVFWVIWFIDRDLIFPSTVDEFMPSWFNHQMHSVIIVNVIGQLFLCYNEHPKSSGLKTLHCLIFCYVSWIFAVYFLEDVWVYPVFIILSWPLKILFLIFAVTVLYCTYFTTEYIHRLIWEKTLEQAKKRKEFTKKK